MPMATKNGLDCLDVPLMSYTWIFKGPKCDSCIYNLYMCNMYVYIYICSLITTVLLFCTACVCRSKVILALLLVKHAGVPAYHAQ